MTFSEEPVCASNSPIVSDAVCPPVVEPPIEREAPLSLLIGGTTYNGYLRVRWEDKIDRLNMLLTTIIKIVMAFQDGLPWIRTKIFTFKNPYNVDRPTADFVVNQRGFPLILSYLDAINDKLDNLHDDLPRIEAVASMVEHYQIPKEAKRPFCAFLFGEFDPVTERIGSGKWQVSVPHGDFEAMDDFDNNFGFRKGNIQFLYTYADNSKIIFYCHDREEGQEVLDRLLEYVPLELQEDGYLKIGDYKGPPFKDVIVRLRRIDWYKEGLLRNKPDFYRAYPNVLT